MECCCSALEKLPAPAKSSTAKLPSPLDRLNSFMCRARWIVSPHPTDSGSHQFDGDIPGWMGAAKAFFWLAAAIASGILVGGLSG